MLAADTRPKQMTAKAFLFCKRESPGSVSICTSFDDISPALSIRLMREDKYVVVLTLIKAKWKNPGCYVPFTFRVSNISDSSLRSERQLLLVSLSRLTLLSRKVTHAHSAHKPSSVLSPAVFLAVLESA